MPESPYSVNVISSFGEFKQHYSGSIRLDAFHEFITGPHDTSDGALLTIEQAYKRVPWVRRGVNLIARSVSHMPYDVMAGGQDITDTSPVTEQLLFVTQKSLEKYSRAYWLIERNRMGKQPTPRFVPAASVRPIMDREQGLVGFKIRFSTGERDFSLEEVVYFHVPNDESETDPDSSPLDCVREPASLLFAANRVVSKFYAGGMVNTSLVILPQQASDDEVKRVEGFFKRMATGLRNAMRVLGVRAGVDVKSVGQSIRESRVPELVSEARDDVAVGLDIPPTVLDGKAANFATAQSEWFGFIVNTIIPKAEFLEETINKQYLQPNGMEMMIHPERLEIMQTAQLDQALAVVKLIGANQFGATQSIITLEEARALLGFPDKPEGELTQPPDAGVQNEPDIAKRMWIDWQRAFAVSSRNGSGKGVVAPNAPDDARRRQREAEMQRILERFFDEQRHRIVEEVA